jgi:hypothetical protein
MHRVVPQPGRLLPLLPLLPRHPSSVACARPRPRRRPTRDRQLSPPGSALCISVVRIGSHGWDETRQEETRRDATRRDEWPAPSNGKASSHPHTLADSHTLTRPGPTSPLPGAALVAAPLDEHVGSRINYSLPGSRRPSQPSALWPSRSCPRRPTSVPCSCPALVACIPWPMSLHSFTSPNTAQAPWRLSLALAVRERLQGQPFAGTAGRPRRPRRRPRRRQSLCLLPN